MMQSGLNFWFETMSYFKSFKERVSFVAERLRRSRVSHSFTVQSYEMILKPPNLIRNNTLIKKGDCYLVVSFFYCYFCSKLFE